MVFYWNISGPHARSKEGEGWVWQFREQRENLPSFDSDEDNSQDDLLVIIFATSGIYQLYTLHEEVHGQILPLVYSLLPSKSKKCYKFMWMKLQELFTERNIYPNLQGYRSDLEIAPIQSVVSVFASLSVSTCFFHFAQAHWRKIQSLGLMDLYTTNEEYKMLLSSFTALGFVPKDKVVE